MNEHIQDSMSVYEIGYLLAGIPEERVSGEAEGIRAIIAKNGGTVIAEEPPKHEKLAYTMRKKTVSGSYETYDEAYFGWFKFELAADKIDAVKKAVEVVAPVLRILVITTVRENTYLGKRTAAADASYTRRAPVVDATVASPKDEKTAPPATIEEMDKSIDEMVKEV